MAWAGGRHQLHTAHPCKPTQFGRTARRLHGKLEDAGQDPTKDGIPFYALSGKMPADFRCFMCHTNFVSRDEHWWNSTTGGKKEDQVYLARPKPLLVIALMSPNSPGSRHSTLVCHGSKAWYNAEAQLSCARPVDFKSVAWGLDSGISAACLRDRYQSSQQLSTGRPLCIQMRLDAIFEHCGMHTSLV